MWEAVRRLEECDLKVMHTSLTHIILVYLLLIIIIQVIVFVCDGAKPNRRFLKGSGCECVAKEGVVYKTVNRYCQTRSIYFMSDVPHLIKTTRNCWYSSHFSGTRYMWVSG